MSSDKASASRHSSINSPSWLDWAGGWRGLLLVLLCQVFVAVLMLVDLKLALMILFGAAVLFAVVERPLLGVCLLIATRLMDVSSNAFLHIGSISIGIFEPTLALASLALLFRVFKEKPHKIGDWPWLSPFLAFVALVVVSLAWSAKRTEGLGEVFSLIVIFANTFIIIYFVRTPAQLMLVIYTWIGASALIGVSTIFSDFLGVSDTGPWKAAESGGRETGLGQQPNWYAMNLMFIVHTTFGLALLQTRRFWRWLLIGLGLFIFVSMMRSGSRGGAYSIVIGGALTALALPIFRKWFFRFAFIALLLFAGAMTLDWGSTTMAFTRIYTTVGHTWSEIRPMNWAVCYQEFIDTWGRGIGAGGYVTLLPKYNWYIYQSVYRYPHGIFWGLMAHYGVPGLVLFGWMAVRIFKMGKDLVAWTRNTQLEVLAWTIPATILGYAAWSFVEFEYNEKPFWEFLALYTALYLIVKRFRESDLPLPALPADAKMLLRVRETLATLASAAPSKDSARAP